MRILILSVIILSGLSLGGCAVVQGTLDVLNCIPPTFGATCNL